MGLRQAMERLAGETQVNDLAFELDAVCAVLGHQLAKVKHDYSQIGT